MVLICNQIFHNKLFPRMHCVNFYLISCFHDERSDFTAYTLLCAKYVIKIFHMKKMKNLEIIYVKRRIELYCY